MHAVSYPFPQQRWRLALQQLPNRSGQRWGQQHACRSAVAAVVGEDDKPHCCRLSCSKRHSHPQGTQARFQGRAHLLLRVVHHAMQAQVGSSAGTLPLATSRPTHHTSVDPALLHKVSDSPPLQHFPLVHSSVHASRQQRGVVRRPPQAPDLQLTSVQISICQGKVQVVLCRIMTHVPAAQPDYISLRVQARQRASSLHEAKLCGSSGRQHSTAQHSWVATHRGIGT